MAKLHIKKGDTVQVISGDDKGKSGLVLKKEVSNGRIVYRVFTMRGTLDRTTIIHIQKEERHEGTLVVGSRPGWEATSDKARG